MQSLKSLIESIQYPWEKYYETLPSCQSVEERVEPTCQFMDSLLTIVLPDHTFELKANEALANDHQTKNIADLCNQLHANAEKARSKISADIAMATSIQQEGLTLNKQLSKLQVSPFDDSVLQKKIAELKSQSDAINSAVENTFASVKFSLQ